MLFTIIFVLLVLWMVGFALDVAGRLIHLLLVAVLLLFIGVAIKGRRT